MWKFAIDLNGTQKGYTGHHMPVKQLKTYLEKEVWKKMADGTNDYSKDLLKISLLFVVT